MIDGYDPILVVKKEKSEENPVDLRKKAVELIKQVTHVRFVRYRTPEESEASLESMAAFNEVVVESVARLEQFFKRYGLEEILMQARNEVRLIAQMA